MEKYVVLKDKEMANGVFDEEIVSFHDTEEAANSKAVELSLDFSEADRDTVTVSVGLVEEKDLEEPGNWDTFTEVEILSIFDNERDA